jgi:uncharacterized protein DUF6843
MGVFVLYAVAAGVTAFDLLYLLVWSTWGSPVHVLEYVALAGAVLLLAAAYLSPWKRHAASQLALTGALAEWAFYLPAVRTTLAGSTPISLSNRAGIYAGLSICLLLLVSIYAGIASFRRDPADNVATPPSKGTKLFILGGTAVLLLGAGIAVFLIGSRRAEQSFDIVLPDGYRGWVRIDFASPGAPALTREDRALLISVPPSGIVKTSTELLGDAVTNRYRYSTQRGSIKLSRAVMLRRVAADGSVQKSEYLFVGDGILQSGEPPDAGEMPVPGSNGPELQGHVR